MANFQWQCRPNRWCCWSWIKRSNAKPFATHLFCIFHPALCILQFPLKRFCSSDFGVCLFSRRAAKLAEVDPQKAKRKAAGGLLAFIGFMLSPLSWWNDAFVNLPLAVGFAWIIALFYKPAFAPSVVIGYWLTNVLGFVLMHKGGAKILSEADAPYSWRHLGRDLIVSLLYTLLIVALIKLKVLQPVADYFQKK
jgi:hypothetical protein